MASSPARLCEKCKVLCFNDQDAGGFVSLPATGAPHLGMCGFDGEGSWSLELDYRFMDSLPHLPNLARSAGQGCEFCKLLRGTVLSDVGASEERHWATIFPSVSTLVDIGLTYVWQADEADRQGPGLMSLEVILSPHSRAGGGHRGEYATVVFRVEGAKGTPGPSNPSARIITDR